MLGILFEKCRLYSVTIIVFLVVSFTSESAKTQTVELSIFDRFRTDMTIDHDKAAAKYMTPFALEKWTKYVMPFFDKKDRQLSHFFAFSMVMPKQNYTDMYNIYFNPWVDGMLITQWRETDKQWRLEDFYFASGERFRGEVTPNSIVSEESLVPVWVYQDKALLFNIGSYYKYMRAVLVSKDIAEIMAWFKVDATERANDLLRVKLRMRARIELAVSYFITDNTGPLLSGSITKFKYDVIAKNREKLASYSKQSKLLMDLIPDITKNWRENWYFKKDDVYTIILSSAIIPKMFVLMNVNSNGKIQRVLLGDLEVMAGMIKTESN